MGGPKQLRGGLPLPISSAAMLTCSRQPCVLCVCVFFGESKAARAPGSYLESRRFALNENGYVSAQECRGCVSANSSCFAGRSWLASWH